MKINHELVRGRVHLLPWITIGRVYNCAIGKWFISIGFIFFGATLYFGEGYDPWDHFPM